jgi:hypothetical protein
MANGSIQLRKQNMSNQYQTRSNSAKMTWGGQNLQVIIYIIILMTVVIGSQLPQRAVQKSTVPRVRVGRLTLALKSNSSLLADKIKKVYFISIIINLISTFIHLSIPTDTICIYTNTLSSLSFHSLYHINSSSPSLPLHSTVTSVPNYSHLSSTT